MRRHGLVRDVALIAAAAVAVVVLAWVTVGRGYTRRTGELEQSIASARSERDAWRGALNEQPVLDAKLQAFVDRTLGGDREAVDHVLRTRLNRIAEGLGLADISVGTGSSASRRSPARSAMSRRGVWRELRDEIDFVELEGWVRGKGDLESVLRLAHAVESEGWIKRVDQMRLDPSENGERFEISIRLTTLFLPGREPESFPPPREDATPFDAYRQVVASNPFRVPPPPAPPPEAVAVTPTNPDPPTPKPPKFAYGQWLLTGVAQGPDGPEVWLRNRKTGETRLVSVGGRLGDASLKDAAGEEARFQLGENRFAVLVGQALNERRPVGDEPIGR